MRTSSEVDENKSAHVPRVTASPVKPFGRFLRQTTDASTLHLNVPALKVVSR